jgi:DNA-binding response OmpR family regulator
MDLVTLMDLMKNKNPRILVIEDNQDVLDAILSILEYSGYIAKGLTRFNDNMFEMLESEPFSLIIMDVVLSGNDGRELISKFKNNKITKDVPVLMISAYPNVEYSSKMAGADGFIPKPFGIDELLEKVESYIDKTTNRKA